MNLGDGRAPLKAGRRKHKLDFLTMGGELYRNEHPRSPGETDSKGRHWRVAVDSVSTLWLCGVLLRLLYTSFRCANKKKEFYEAKKEKNYDGNYEIKV